MAALAADRLTDTREPGLRPYPVKAATKIYQGGLVAVDGSGWVVPAADAAGLKVVGVADKTVNNTAGANGDLKVMVKSGKEFLLDASSITQAMVGQLMYVVDDQTFDDAKGTNGIVAGLLMEYVSATKGWLLIDPAIIAKLIEGAGSGYKIARGQLTTVTAADTVVTGLSEVVAVVATLDADPGDDPEAVSATIGDQAGTPAAGSVIIKTWKNSGTDPTPLAATTFSKKVNWVAIGK